MSDLRKFNEKFPIGASVIYIDDFKVGHVTKIRSEAWALGHGDLVVKVEGRTGGVDVNRIIQATL